MKNAFFAMLVCAFSSIAAAQVMVVRAGRLVDPDSGTVLTDQVIVVVDRVTPYPKVCSSSAQ